METKQAIIKRLAECENLKKEQKHNPHLTGYITALQWVLKEKEVKS